MEQADVQKIIFEKAHEQSEITLAYLRQEGLFDGKPFAIVDLGWFGRVHNSLSRLLRIGGGKSPWGLYVGLRRSGYSNDNKISYLYDEIAKQGWLIDGPSVNCLLEIFCSADHGTVVGYRRGDGRIIPVLAEQKNEHVLAWGLDTIRETIYCFIDQLNLDPSLFDWRSDLRPAIMELLRSFWLTPSQRDAMVWSDFFYEDDQNATFRAAFVRPYGWFAAFRALLTGNLPALNRTSWNQGCLAVTPTLKRSGIKLRFVFNGK